MTTTNSNWKNDVLAMVRGRTRVHEALTLAEVLAEVAMAHRSLSLADWKRGMVELYKEGRIQLDDYTRALADVADEPAVIEYHAENGYGVKWFVRDDNTGV